jgi:hypothetical protein
VFSSPAGAECISTGTQRTEARVTLIKDVSETDRYDRLLRYVIAGDFLVNYELVRCSKWGPNRYRYSNSKQLGIPSYGHITMIPLP